MKKFFSNAIVIALLISTGCTSLNSAQKHELAEWEGEKLKVEHKNESLAAGLNVLPGIGDFYNGNVGLGIVNLLTWPASILWAPVGGATGAAEANYFMTKAHVDKLTKKRQATINELQAAAMTKQITNDEFYIASQKVNNMQLNDFSNKNYTVFELVPRLGQEMGRIPSSNQK
jgi:outer membrane murein-binding lipoprotein Lpp